MSNLENGSQKSNEIQPIFPQTNLSPHKGDIPKPQKYYNEFFLPIQSREGYIPKKHCSNRGHSEAYYVLKIEGENEGQLSLINDTGSPAGKRLLSNGYSLAEISWVCEIVNEKSSQSTLLAEVEPGRARL